MLCISFADKRSDHNFYTFHKILRYYMKIKNIFFCHGGIHGIFMYLGAIKELYKQREKLDLSRLRIYGSSSGGPLGLICLLVLNDILEIDFLIKTINTFFAQNSTRSAFKFTQTCIELLELLCLQINDPSEVVSLANKHLYIGLSQKSGFKYVNRFSSLPEILHCLLLGSNLVLLATYPAYDNNGVVSIDSGFMMTKYDLPRRCLSLQNKGSTFPGSVGIPDDEKQDELINKGIGFVKELLSSKNKYKVENEMFGNYSDTFIDILFFLQLHLARNNYEWMKRIYSIKCNTT